MKALLMAGALALSLSAQQAHSQQQAIPDAPKPQTTLPPVTPGIGADGASTSTPPATPADGDADQAPVGSTLPSSQKPAVAAQDSDPVPDAGAAPDLSAAKLPTLRLTSNFVEIPFTVKDSRHQLVPGITWRDVRVYENSLRQHMSVFTVDPIPLSIAIVVDQSLPHQTMEEVNAALGALPAVFTPYDSVAVFTYNNGPRMLTDFTAGSSPRLSAVVEEAKSSGRENMYYAPGEGLENGIRLNGGAQDNLTPLTSHTASSPGGLQQVPRDVHTLNDAILMAAESLTKSGPDRRRIVYVISDGKEYGSQAKQKDVIKYLQTNQISVYASLVGDSSLPVVGYLDHIHIPLMMRDNLLPYYVNATGGQTFAENRVRGLENSFQQITEQVRTQYTVGYYPNTHGSPLDGKFRNVEIRVMRPNLDVIAPKGYYPTPKASQANVARTRQTTQP